MGIERLEGVPAGWEEGSREAQQGAVQALREDSYTAATLLRAAAQFAGFASSVCKRLHHTPRPRSKKRGKV